MPAAGPAMPTAASPAARARPRAGLLVGTLVVAVFALVVGVAAVVMSALALGRSDDAVTIANVARNERPVPPPGPPPTGPPPTGPPTTDRPTTGPTGTDQPAPDPTATGPTAGPTEISPTAKFDVAYEGEKLRVRSKSCGYSGGRMYVDLDNPPTVGVGPENAEFDYDGCDPGKIGIDLPFAQVPGATATPKDCLESIRTDPGRSPVAPTRGMTLCIVTSQDKAAAAGTTQKLVFVTVDAITVDNQTGVLNVTAKAWTVPQ
ncbi:hypothetical protein [Paractinoplanes ferrugineus]|nr:hypothetical protein [Actinoplanes ferrugineus]